MGKPRGVCRFLKRRGFRALGGNVQPVFRFQAWSLWKQLQREEGLLPLSEQQSHMERGLRRVLRESLVSDALDHFPHQLSRGMHHSLSIQGSAVRRLAERVKLLVREQGTST